MIGNGINLGKIFGIRISVDLSWILIFLLVTWNLAGGVFPAMHPNWPAALNWGLGLLAALLFFASVLAHELAHSLVATMRGLPVTKISLFLFGGVSNIEREPESPRSEFLVAIVGPLTSLILGVLFIVIGRLASGRVQMGLQLPSFGIAQLNPVATIFLWLGPINILLAIFNMIPGFPLDGGRVLRSIIWGISGNLKRATQLAAVIGQIVAWAFILLGIGMVFGISIPFFGTGIISGIWLVFIGWFLNNAAVQSRRQVVIGDILDGVPVMRLIRTTTATVPPELPVSSLVDQYLLNSDDRSVPVTSGDQLVGLVCVEDVRKVPRERWDATQVSEIMTPASDLDVISPSVDALEAFNKLSSRDVRQIPVVQNGHLIGLIRRQDIIRWLQLHSSLVTG